ncbi:putative sugar transporter [Bisporella sp. PMI_857]|nr:putative sugar transporter [Bisporella sp. PMI_857]
MAMLHYEEQNYNMALLNASIESIGMGKYQWQMFFTCGFGFVVDQILLITIALVMPQASKEFDVQYPKMATVAQYSGLLLGALSCGIFADLFGRSLVWQIALFGITIWTLVCAASPNFASLAVFIGLMSFFGGGNLAIDLTLFCEVLPKRKSWLLTLLAVMWGVGNAVTTLIGWPLISNFSCPPDATPATCKRGDNMGWRYVYITTGGLCFVMAIIRVFVLNIEESPKWLVAEGKYEKACTSFNKIAKINNADIALSIDQFRGTDTSPEEISAFESFSLYHIQGLFQGKKRAISTASIFLLWMCIGVAYPIYTVFLAYYLAAHGAKLGDGSTYQTYRDLTISSVVGIFGPALAAYLIELKFLGRRGGMAIMAIVTAAFAGAFTSVNNEAQNIAFSCMINFWQNGYYAILYAYTPEVMPTAHRGTGCGLAMACGRLASLAAPFIGTFGDVTSSVPIWVCMALYFVMAGVALMLPYESKTYDDSYAR